MGWGRAGILAVVAALALAAAGPAAAAGWEWTRDRAMGLREAGRAAEAYQAVSTYRSRGSGFDAYGAQFVAGFISLRSLNRPDVALGHFSKMATIAATLPAKSDPAGSKATAGYWMGRTLTALGRTADARKMYLASAAYPHTFYGQLSAAEAKVPIQGASVAGVAKQYPQKELYWHDQRARRELVLAVIREESRFRPTARSPVGAQGMMQVMPDTARGIGKSAGVAINQNLMATNADYNIAVGSRYLADQLDKYRGNAMLAAAAYNAGPGAVDKWLRRFGDPRGGSVDPVDFIESIPFDETRAYVKKVIGSYVTYIALGAD